MSRSHGRAVVALHLGCILALFALHFVLPPYHHANLARIMVLAVYAMGYNLAFGYTGLLSLGHALYFASGIYAAGLLARDAGWSAVPAFGAGTGAGALMALATGLLALRATGVAFMIISLMFAQAAYLFLLWQGAWTGGDEGFVLSGAARSIGTLSLADEGTRYLVALALLAMAVIASLCLVRSPWGRVFVAMRENAERSRMLGFDPFRYRLGALVASGCFAGASGAAYALLFGYVGATFASVQYSILPLLWVLLGGAGTVLGPFLGTLLMFYLVDRASDFTDAYMLVVGAALLGLVLFAPRGLLGVVRGRWWPWLP